MFVVQWVACLCFIILCPKSLQCLLKHQRISLWIFFFFELKQRNIFKVATTYAIAGWLIIQIVTFIDEPLSLPGWFATTIIVLVL